MQYVIVSMQAYLALASSSASRSVHGIPRNSTLTLHVAPTWPCHVVATCSHQACEFSISCMNRTKNPDSLLHFPGCRNCGM